MSSYLAAWIPALGLAGVVVGWYLRSLVGRASHHHLRPGERWLPCPFCGNGDLDVYGGGKITVVCCGDCEAEAPATVWNCRAGFDAGKIRAAEVVPRAPKSTPIIPRSIPAGERGHGDLGFLGVVIGLVVIAGPIVAGLGITSAVAWLARGHWPPGTVLLVGGVLSVTAYLVYLWRIRGLL